MNKYIFSRRQFLKQAAAAAAATALPGGALGRPGSLLAAPILQEVAPGVPRAECLILENPGGTVLPADDFNRWRSGYGAFWINGLQQLACDALWYIDPEMAPPPPETTKAAPAPLPETVDPSQLRR